MPFGSDPTHRGVLVPEEFYKVVVVVDDAVNQLSATAFCQSQADLMPTPERITPEAPFDPGRFVVDQITLAELEDDGAGVGGTQAFRRVSRTPDP